MSNVQNFIQKKKKNQNQNQRERTVQTCRDFIQAKKKKKHTGKTKSWHGIEKGNFVQMHSSSFSPSFSLHFGEIELWWAQRENSWAPPLFSPPPPLIQTPISPIFSPIFHSFFSILPKIHPSKHSLKVTIVEWIIHLLT